MTFRAALFRWMDRIVSAVLLFAGSGKLLQSHHFAVTLHEPGVIPPFLVPLIAGLLSSVEVIAGLALLMGRLPLGARLIAAVLFLLFGIFHLGTAYAGLRVKCGCFGTFVSDIEGGWPIGLVAMLVGSCMLVGCGAEGSTLARRRTACQELD